MDKLFSNISVLLKLYKKDELDEKQVYDLIIDQVTMYVTHNHDLNTLPNTNWVSTRTDEPVPTK
jgi:hypothetical protein